MSLDSWKKENTLNFGMRLQKTTDADLIEWLADKPSRQGEIKRLMRIAIALEKEQK